MTSTTERIRLLNDELRCANKQGTMLLTRGVAALSPILQQQVMHALITFSAFDADNDPYGEHDCATFRVGSERLLFKIDYYDRSGDHHSPDPADPAVTRRVLTLMLAEEY